MIKAIVAVKACTAMLLALSLGACATKLGRNFDDAYVQKIKPGETTKAEIREKLGRPPLRSRVGDEEIWTYAYYEGRGWLGYMTNVAFSDEVDPTLGKQKRLTIVFQGDSVKDSKFVVELPRPEL